VSEDGDRWRTIVTGKIRDSDISQVVFDEPVLAQYLMIRQRGSQKGLSEVGLNNRGLMDQRYYKQMMSE
ncbi:MAG: hypothetical protein AB7E95_08750, partial [Kiritimatiellales bacterium]